MTLMTHVYCAYPVDELFWSELAHNLLMAVHTS